MLYNYIKISVRSFLKQKGLSAINVLGLGIGLACFTLFSLYALHEFSFDNFHKDGDRIYRMYRWTEDLDGEGVEGDAHLPMPLAVSLLEDFPDVEEVTRWKDSWGDNFVRVNDRISRAGLTHVDQSIFKMFSFPLLYGDMSTALADPKNVVLSEKVALRLFGERNPIGKLIEIKIGDEFISFNVAGVTENVPSNSTKNFEILGSLEYFASTANGKRRKNNWNSSFLNVFVKLRKGSNLATNSTALLKFRQKYYPDQERELRESGLWKDAGPPVTYKLQPIDQMHTETAVLGGGVASINPKTIWLLSLISSGVLFIAIVNFTTLSVARSAGRAKEVGVRKVMGGARKSLIGQFFTESMIMSLLAMTVGLVLVGFFLPYFNQLSSRDLSLSFGRYPELVWIVIGMTIFTGLVSGFYPAIILSNFRPVDVFNRGVRLGGSNLFTKSLVTSQFVISIGLIIAMMVILNQLNFLQNHNPGFNKENIVVVDANETNSDQIYPRFKELLSTVPDVLGVASSESSLGQGEGWSRAGFDYKGEYKQVYEYYVDDNYLSLMGLRLLTGRFFMHERQDGLQRSVVINNSMMHDFGWSIDNAVGQKLKGYDEDSNEPTVIGVVQDFSYRSFRELVKPQMFHQFEDYSSFKYFVKIKAGDPTEAIGQLQEAWSSVETVFPFKYSFLDENLDRFYREEERMSQVVIWAGGISILLACLGLMGLASLAVINRKKEIGIRKVLGSSVSRVIQLISIDFIKLILVAFIIAIPSTWYVMNKWLENFAFRIELEWWMFAISGIGALTIAFLTLSYHSVRAAHINPVDSLREE